MSLDIKKSIQYSVKLQCIDFYRSVLCQTAELLYRLTVLPFSALFNAQAIVPLVFIIGKLVQKVTWKIVTGSAMVLFF